MMTVRHAQASLPAANVRKGFEVILAAFLYPTTVAADDNVARIEQRFLPDRKTARVAHDPKPEPKLLLVEGRSLPVSSGPSRSFQLSGSRSMPVSPTFGRYCSMRCNTASADSEPLGSRKIQG